MPSITYIWTTFIKATFSKSIIFKVKSIFEPNVFKWVIKIVFINSSPFPLLIINVKILLNFQKGTCTFGKKKRTFEKKQGLSILDVWMFLNMKKHFWFVSSFEHVNFAINGKLFQKQYDNPNYYASFMIFQTYKNVVFLRSVLSLRWLLWLWFYPCAFSPWLNFLQTIDSYKLISSHEHYNFLQHLYNKIFIISLK